MKGAVALQGEATEHVLIAEREAIVAWLVDLEGRAHRGDPRHERMRQLRRIIGKLDNRIRLIRDLDRIRQTQEPDLEAPGAQDSIVPNRIPAKRSR